MQKRLEQRVKMAKMKLNAQTLILKRKRILHAHTPVDYQEITFYNFQTKV